VQLIAQAWAFALAHQSAVESAVRAHLALSASALGAAAAVCLPLGLLASRHAWGRAAIVAVNGLRGTILNMASVLGFAPQAGYFATHAYAAAKGGIAAMSRSLAACYAPHKIRVNVVAPGLVRTPASERAQATPELREFIGRKQPLSGGMIDAEDVARAALFLLSEEARCITGEVLTVDAGWRVTDV